MPRLVVAIVVANLQLASEAPMISVAVLDDARVPGEWLRQAKNELERIYREIDVNIVWWDPDLPSSRGDQATVPQGLLTIATDETPRHCRKNFPRTRWGLHPVRPLSEAEWRMSSTTERNDSHHSTVASISGTSWRTNSAIYCFPNMRTRSQGLCVRSEERRVGTECDSRGVRAH